MGNCCFPSKIQLEDRVAGDERLIPEDEISLFLLEEFDCYMLIFRLRNFNNIVVGSGLKDSDLPI